MPKKKKNKEKNMQMMKRILKVAYSTEVFSEKTICYDTTSYEYSAVYEFKDSYSEYSSYRQYEEEAWY